MQYTLHIHDIGSLSAELSNTNYIEELLGIINKKKITITYDKDSNNIRFINSDNHNVYPSIVTALNAIYEGQELESILQTLSEFSGAIWSLPETQEQLISRLATLDPINRDKAIKEKSKELGCNVSTLNTLVKEAQRSEETLSDKMEVEKAFITEYYNNLYKISLPKPIEGKLDEVLTEIEELIRKYFYMPYKSDYTLATYWCVYTWWAEKMPYNPLAFITAPDYSCGKTELMKFLSRLSKKPMVATRSSVSNVVKIVSYIKPTLFIDEADITMTEDVRSVINDGVLPDGCSDIQVFNDEYKRWLPELYNVYSPKCICGVGKQNRSIETRSVILHMGRAPKNHPLEDTIDFYEDGETIAKVELLKSKLAYLAQNTELPKRIKTYFPGRYGQIFRPLLMIALLAGPQHVAKLKIAFAESMEVDYNLQDVDTQTQLLHAMYDIFIKSGKDELTTTYIIVELIKDDEACWSRYSKNNDPINAWNIKKELAKFGDTSVRSKLVGQNRLGGYAFSDIEKLYKLYNKRGK